MDSLHASLLHVIFLFPTLKPVKLNLISLEPKHEYKVSLSMKKTNPPYDPPVYSNTSDFKQLVKHSQVFIDNSLLIEGIFEESTFQSKYLRIGVPPKWGKTVNMKMLQAFFEIQVHQNGTPIEPKETTSNYRLFREGRVILDGGTVEHLSKPFLIHQNDQFCRQHLGQYPVMYLPFQNITGDTVEEIKQSVDDFIQQVYNEFKYIMIPMVKHQSKIKIDSYIMFKVDRFNQTILGNISDHTFALEFLSQILNEHFSKKVVVIIDDYSAPSIAARKNQRFGEHEIYQVDELINDMTYKLTHNFNHNQLIIIIGSEDVHLPTFENFWDNNITARDLPWFKHFGFNQQDVGVLFEKRTVSEELLKLPVERYETRDQDVSMATMAQYLNRDEVKKVLFE
ncbi:uncharacterized protein LOC135844231 [Planococcus citri]|uniref:uncharacterized protein LOC135844231 n=1 Tax=Planococcus citri TaxID=170843 RepID=UPI0031F7E1AD